MSAAATVPKLDPLDPLALDAQLDDEERLIRDTVRQYVREKFLPVVGEHFEAGTLPENIGTDLGSLGLLGMHLEGYGCAGASATAYGLTCLELEAGDSGLRSFCSVQGSLAMFAIWKLGQRGAEGEVAARDGRGHDDRLLRADRAGRGLQPRGDAHAREEDRRRLGAQRLEDVDHQRLARRRGDRLGARPRTARSTASSSRRACRASARRQMHGKLSLRASITSELVLDGVEVPEENRLPEATSLRAPLSCLNEARFGIVFGAAGAARACYESALDYAKTRVQFDKPIAGYQLTQAKLVEMAVKVGQSTLLALHLGRMKDAGTLSTEQVSFGKYHNVSAAMEVARVGPHGARRERHHARVSGPAPRQQPRVRAHLRGHARDAHADPRQRHHGPARLHE